MKKTYIVISERPTRGNRERIIMHDNWQWHIGKIRNEQDLQEVLDFLEIELTTVEFEKDWEDEGKTIAYNLSKYINNPYSGGFWNMEQLKEVSKGERLKKFKGLSNGSIVDCYIGIDDNTNIVNIYRPNPNAKEVYKNMELQDEMNYRINNWYL